MPPSFDLGSLLRRQYVGPPIPTPEALTTALATAQRSFDKRCEVLRHVDSDTPEGGSSWQWTQAGVYQCRLEPVIEAKDLVTVGPLTAVGYHLFLPNFADIRPSDRVGVPGWFNAWRADYEYPVGSLVIPTTLQSATGHYYEAIIEESSSSGPGVSGSVEPAWNAQHRSLASDGDITWREVGPCSYFEVTGDEFDKSHEFEIMVRLKEIA